MTSVYFDEVTVLGVGLLGGSLGLAMRRRNLARRIVGWGRNRERLANARTTGAIDASETDLHQAVAASDLIICCTPVRHILDLLPEIARAARPGALVTDVGSTKEAIVRAAKPLAERGIDFIGSHPMAGSDQSGVQFARPDLYVGATVFVTVEKETPKDKVAEVADLWRALGAKVALAHPHRHDRLVAAVSHLPHLLAVAAVRTVSDVHDDINFLRWVIGAGFRDTTRVAQGSTDMWRDICTTNPQAIVEMLDAFREKIDEIRAEVAAADERHLVELLEEARQFRKQLEPGE